MAYAPISAMSRKTKSKYTIGFASIKLQPGSWCKGLGATAIGGGEQSTSNSQKIERYEHLIERTYITRKVIITGKSAYDAKMRAGQVETYIYLPPKIHRDTKELLWIHPI